MPRRIMRFQWGSHAGFMAFMVVSSDVASLLL